MRIIRQGIRDHMKYIKMEKKKESNPFEPLNKLKDLDIPQKRFSVKIDLHLRLKEEIIENDEERGDPLYMPVDYSPREPRLYSDRKVPELEINTRNEVDRLINTLKEIKNYNPQMQPSNITRSEGNIIESYAIVLISISREDECTVLLGRRRDSIEYSDFIRGLYVPKELVGIISMMTKDEHERILKYDISVLWKDYWPINSEKYHQSRAYSYAKRVYNSNIDAVKQLIKLIGTKREETEWLLPRGRAKGYKDVDYREVAIKEFEEETCLSLDKCKKSVIQPYRELYTGSNGDKFATTHYIYVTENEMLPRKKRVDDILRGEFVSNDFDMVKWFTLEECKIKLNNFRYGAVEELFRLVKQKNNSQKSLF